MATMTVVGAGAGATATAAAVRPASSSYSDLAPLRARSWNCSCGREAGAGADGRRWSLVVEAKGKGRRGIPGQGPPRQPAPTMPKLEDDGNPKFVLFVRSRNVARWYPLSVVTGGTTAKLMVAAMGNEWGKKLYQGTLTRNIGGVIYKDERAMRAGALKMYPVLKAASAFDFGYKIWDKDNPKSAMFGTDVIQVPPKEELKSVVDKVKEFFGKNAEGIKDTFGSITSLSFGSEDAAAEEEASTKKEPSKKQ